MLTYLRTILLLLPVFCLATASAALAAGGAGLYIAPKFVGTYMQPSDYKGHHSYAGSIRTLTVKKPSAEMVFGGGLAVGYDFHPAQDLPLRLELEFLARERYSQKKNYTYILTGTEPLRGTAKLDVSAYTGFFNAYFDLHNSSMFTPYVGAGVGVALLHTDIDDGMRTTLSGLPLSGQITKFGKEKRTVFAWNAGAGVACKISDSFSLDLGARYTDLGKFQGKGSGVLGMAGNPVFRPSGKYEGRLRAVEGLLTLRATVPNWY